MVRFGAWSVVFCVLCALCACGRYGFTANPGDAEARNDGMAPGDGSGHGDDALGADGAAGDGGAPNPSDLVLFVRGGSGTVGLNNSGGDANACDTNDHTSGEGWAALAAQLTTLGFSVVEHFEGSSGARAPADLSNLDQYGIVVFGSNNFAYPAGDGAAVDAYVRRGGGALFISDAGFCSTNFDEAPSSDQVFLNSFNLVMDQDSGIGTPTTVVKAAFLMPAHAVLANVTSFEAIGTSPITVVDTIADITPVILVNATGQIRNNDAPNGTFRNATSQDAALVVAQVGAGRVAAYFDRDTFTTNTLAKDSDKTLATNIFRWLHGQI